MSRKKNASSKGKSKKKNKQTTKKGNARGKKIARALLMEKRILGFLKEHKAQSFSSKQIASNTGLWSDLSINQIRSHLDSLASAGRVEYLERGKYKYAYKSNTLSGKIEVTRSGSGYLLVDEGQDIFIHSKNMDKALHGDFVKIKVLSKRQKERKPEGIVLEVLQRSKTEFVGVVEKGLTGSYFLLADDPRIRQDFYISSKNLMGAKDGEKVYARLLNWDKKSPEVEVINVLGEAGDHNTEMHAILYQFGFDPKFPPHVEAEAEAIKEEIPASEYKARRDMRKVTTFTIDPHDAKDFDDALSFQVLENGNYEVGVHIADVSYYVKPDSPIDREAFKRATSVYLVDRTVPMLPEKLSNKVCSLRPHEEKLTYSAIFEMDKDAKVINYWVGRTVIYSDHRFNYDEAQEVIEGLSKGPFKEEIGILNDLALKLRAKRMNTGSIEFESNEVKFELDENDKPIRVIRKIMKDSNHLIEDFMLLANRTVAKHLFQLQKNPPLPSVYRIHDHPNPEKLAKLQEFVKGFGHEVDFQGSENTSDKLNKLLTQVRGNPEQNVIETIAVRSMAKAIYSTQNVGHFGLGFEFYSHFTSPIRRYPDLMIHRLVTNYHNKQYRENPNLLEEQSKHCSDRERTAAEAERASVKYKQVEFLEDKVGAEFDGIISGVIEAGIFVQLDENLCEGMVPAHSMDDDYYAFDEKTYALVGRDHGKALRLGDPVRVEITGTDMKRRTIDMALV